MDKEEGACAHRSVGPEVPMYAPSCIKNGWVPHKQNGILVVVTVVPREGKGPSA